MPDWSLWFKLSAILVKCWSVGYQAWFNSHRLLKKTSLSRAVRCSIHYWLTLETSFQISMVTLMRCLLSTCWPKCMALAYKTGFRRCLCHNINLWVKTIMCCFHKFFPHKRNVFLPNWLKYCFQNNLPCLGEGTVHVNNVCSGLFVLSWAGQHFSFTMPLSTQE